MERTEVDAIAYHTRKPVILDSVDYFHLAALPESAGGWKLHDLRPYRKLPEQRQGLVRLHAVDSLIEYVNKHGDENSLVLCAGIAFGTNPLSRASANIHCTLDHHGPTDEQARSQRHTAEVMLPLASQASWWIAGNNYWMDQAEFTEFIDTHRDDIAEPNGAAVVELIRSLEATTNKTFSADIDMEEGRHIVKLSTDQQVRSKIAGVEIPKVMMVRIPIFHRGQLAELTARIQRKLDDDGKLQLRYTIPRLQENIDQAFMTVVGDIRKGLTINCPVLEGGING